MADFRKLLFVLIAGALLFTTVASAEPFSCSITPTQTIVRVEGLADYVGDIILNCWGDVPDPAVGIKNVNIRFTTNNNVNITSNILNTSAQVTEASMIMNEGLTAGGRIWYGNGTYAGQNVYQAVKISDTAVEWQNVTIAGPSSNPFKTIRLTNIRVNATGMPVGTAISGYINITSPTSFPIYGTSNVVVANVLKGLIFSVTPSSYASCGPPPGTTLGTFRVTFTEGYSAAFKRQGDALAENYIPQGNYPTESGWAPGPGGSGIWGGGSLYGYSAYVAAVPAGIGTPAVAAVPTGNSIGQANNPTTLLARLKNIPLGITSVSASVYSDGYLATSVVASSIASDRSATITVTVTGYDDNASVSATEAVKVDITLSTAGGMTPAPGGIVLANGTFAPISTVGVMSAIDPEPRFVDTGTPDYQAFTMAGVCRTLLLFPYLTNQAGFDTGIVISNTTKDPLGTQPQNVSGLGACTMYYYGFVGGNLAVPVLQAGQNAGVAVSPDVPSGGQLILLLSAGGGNSIPVGPGVPAACAGCAPVTFQGYMIASCNFQYAHGYAFVSDTGATKLAQGYLALVIPDRSLRLVDPFTTGGTGTGEQLTN